VGITTICVLKWGDFSQFVGNDQHADTDELCIHASSNDGNAGRQPNMEPKDFELHQSILTSTPDDIVPDNEQDGDVEQQ
jgi:hypothetical protein